MRRVTRKLVFGFFLPGQTQTGLCSHRKLCLEISDLGSRGIALSMKRKQRCLSAVQLLRLCFHIYVKSRFSHDVSHIMLNVTFWSGTWVIQ